VSFGGNYALALALVAGPGAVVIVILTALGIEAKGAVFGTARVPQPAEPKSARSPVLSSA
jgi:SHS family lactate transporter-like MFS transporter